MDDYENENDGFEKNSDLERLFELLRQAKQEYESGNMDISLGLTGDDLLSGMLKQNIEDEVNKLGKIEHLDCDRTESISKDGVDIVIKYWYVPDAENGVNVVKTMEVIGNENDLSKSEIEDLVTEITLKDAFQQVSVNAYPENKVEGLKSQLTNAILIEDYDKAVIIRDKINVVREKIADKIQKFNETVDSGNKEIGNLLLDEIRRLKDEL